MNYQHFPRGINPLFTFQSHHVFNCGTTVNMNLLDSTLVNVTSTSSDLSPFKQQFGSDVYQRVVGSRVSCCTNHDSGTGMMSPNLGGNVMYVTSVTFTLCTFNEMAATGSGRAVIFFRETSSSLAVQTCLFHRRVCTADSDDGEHLTCDAALQRHDHSLPQTPLSRTVLRSSRGLIQLWRESLCGQCILNVQALAYPQISITSAPITIDRCTFSKYTLTDSALIQHTGSILSVSGGSFKGISRRQGESAVLASTFTDGMELHVDGVTLDTLASETGLADGLLISFLALASPSHSTPFSLTNLIFKQSSSSNTDSSHFVTIVGNDFSSWIATENRRFAGSYESLASGSWLWSVDEETGLSGSVVFCLKEGSGPVGVSDTGYAISKCGFFSVWCKGLEYGLAVADAKHQIQIDIHDTVTVDTLIDLNEESRICRKGSSSVIVLTQKGWFVIDSGVEVIFDGMTLEVVGNADRSALEVLDGHVRLNNARVVVNTESTLFFDSASHLTLESSVVVVSDCVLDGKGTSLASQHAIDVSQSTLTMNATTIQNISSADGESSNAVVLHDAAGAFTRCTFASLSSSAVGGAVHAALSSSTSLTITSCSFGSCWPEGNGGSVSVVVDLVAGGELAISASNFTSSSSQQNGGALFVDLSSLGAGSSRLTSLTFASSCRCSGDGKWVFLKGRDFGSLVTKERLEGPFDWLSLRSDADKLWGLDLAEDASSPRHSILLLHFLLGRASRTADSTVFVGQSGEDNLGCGGTADTRCGTVEWSAKEAAGSVVDIVVVSSGLLSSPIVLSNADVQIAPDLGRYCPFAVSLDNPSSAPTSMISVGRNSVLLLCSLSMSFSLAASIDSVVISSSGVVNVDLCRIQKTTLSQPFLVSTHSSHTISNTSFLSSTFTSSAFVLSACHSLSIETTTVSNNTFESSLLVGSSSRISILDLRVSNNTLKQNSSLFPLSIIPKTTSADTPSIHISSSSFSSSPTTPTPLFVSVASDCALNVVVVNSTFSHSSSSQNRTPAVVVKWTPRQPLLLRRRVV
ncbi:hypothetical protein BLNAU_17143 [Blattamonas nauphoetae]|uniref:Uncharacterized protein n=1 Tax=Blattamonas nauphoetae TaxID=2049346 RepID=A0ABQ9X7N1_9EUKA|nr:hypothetical protein BLNAU_17143 [Blattamonas nauphoetae]